MQSIHNYRQHVLSAWKEGYQARLIVQACLIVTSLVVALMASPIFYGVGGLFEKTVEQWMIGWFQLHVLAAAVALVVMHFAWLYHHAANRQQM
ncbi:hypothetical protein IC617_08505 [Neiella sp. HB171785]|uniref:Uncharacterized protein n=1 Tax=Neiella litorisoli TaxID=2771431 RepID=A0A8J6QQL2_9GAMM|nr:hypothetical protein [Neiella litorisoli]MBD1389466.1 hypothetical protein [Neiella litorisoli]